MAVFFVFKYNSFLLHNNIRDLSYQCAKKKSIQSNSFKQIGLIESESARNVTKLIAAILLIY